jgi:hypothetical protein
MKMVSDLSKKQIDLIVHTLEADGFKNIKLSGNTICFCEGDKVKRQYEIISTDMDNRDDLGVRMDFDYEKFLEKNYIHKTRHSVSLKDAIERKGSLEDACEDLEWELLQVKDLNKDDNQWHAGLHTDAIYEVQIGAATHIIANEEVYEGDLARIWSMGNKSVRQLLSGYNICSVLDKLNQE